MVRLRASSQVVQLGEALRLRWVGRLGRVRLQPPPIVVERNLPVVSDTFQETAPVVVSICALWPASTRRPTPRADRCRRPQLAGCDHHLLEHAEARQGRLHQEERRPRRTGRIPGPRLATRMGTHQPDRRIPVVTCRPTFNVKTLTVGSRPLPQTTRSPRVQFARSDWSSRSLRRGHG